MNTRAAGARPDPSANEWNLFRKASRTGGTGTENLGDVKGEER